MMKQRGIIVLFFVIYWGTILMFEWMQKRHTEAEKENIQSTCLQISDDLMSVLWLFISALVCNLDEQ